MLSLVQNVHDCLVKLVITNSDCRAASTPKMSLRISQTSFGMAFEEFVCGASLEKLHGFFISHAFWQCRNYMHMIGQNINNLESNVMARSCFTNASFAKTFVPKLCKHFITVFCLPIHVPKVDANFVVVMFQFNYLFHFRCSAQRKLTLNDRELSVPKIRCTLNFLLRK